MRHGKGVLKTLFWLAVIAVGLIRPGVAVSAGVQGGDDAGKAPKSTAGKIVVEYTGFPDSLAQYEVYPWETLRQSDFKSAYGRMLGSKGWEEWVASLTGTGNQNRMVRAFKEQFVLVASCRPHSCDSGQILLLFSPARKKSWAIYADEGKFTYLGDPDKRTVDLLKVLLVEEFKEVYKGQ